MAIISQENSAMWVGTFDMEKLEFTSDGTIYNFPRDNHCDVSEVAHGAVHTTYASKPS